MAYWREWLTWNLYGRWRFHWDHRRDTLEQRREFLMDAWEATLDSLKDEPATRELHDAIEGIEKVKQMFKV